MTLLGGNVATGAGATEVVGAGGKDTGGRVVGGSSTSIVVAGVVAGVVVGVVTGVVTGVVAGVGAGVVAGVVVTGADGCSTVGG